MNKIYVGNLSFNATEPELKELFGQYGEISEMAFIRDRETNQPKGFCFITYNSQQEAQDALAMNDKEFLGRTLKVNIAKPKESGGGRGGDNKDRSRRR